jgi:hypothetical protein
MTGICKECKNHAVLHGDDRNGLRCKDCDAKFIIEVRDYLKGLNANLDETLTRFEDWNLQRECQDILRGAIVKEIMTKKQLHAEATQMEVTQEMLNEATQIWSYLPYRQCWIAQKDGEHFRIVCEATARRANILIRDGWSVYKLVRG